MAQVQVSWMQKCLHKKVALAQLPGAFIVTHGIVTKADGGDETVCGFGLSSFCCVLFDTFAPTEISR
jgi:hypothetical protein